MAKLHFAGDIPGSKSVFNRALIVKSYFPDLQLKGFSECDDVRHMREGILALGRSPIIDCGEGGTTFRFLALRASREKGRHHLKAQPRLLQRPQKGLLDLLKQLGVQATITTSELVIESSGWKKPLAPLRVNTTESSQYASALILNSWLLDFDLQFELVGDKVSESYFLLTLEMLKALGLQVSKVGSVYTIPQGQKITAPTYTVEIDISSAFTMATAGALAGDVLIQNFSPNSTQPDVVFIDIFKKMNVDFVLTDSQLHVQESASLVGVEWNLSQSPDLFPVLAVLCSWARGVSRLFGAPHLVSKESNRIAKVSELLTLVGVHHESLPDGMIIHGNPDQKRVHDVSFNPDQDHRMVMAAVLMKLKGHGITVEEPHVINKSFPEFWEMIGINP